ncbi:glucosamine-6-phosphate deaminase [Microbacterium sulfonylureivorans]|uniref:glucosamine-6-phosphate deaminase n=1 Tax=Microbacterium sulfonylureivorans TaxID=2486854 RepID=UPI000FDB4027|nr:glucosamine-6-phosphate deaminase [Microbacterium sulfonylureivorans]
MADVNIFADPGDAAAVVADLVLRAAHAKPDLVLGVATGATPLLAYRLIGQLADRDSVALDRVRGFALDEYLGLEPGHPSSYRATVDSEIAPALGVAAEHILVPEPHPSDPTDAGRAFEASIRAAGGIDVQILGIGSTGHIGFNEPGSSLSSRTRIKTLSARTRDDNARYFASPDDVPHHAITQGIGTILEARHLILMAFGEQKANAIAEAIEGGVTARVPASAVQLHPHVTVIVDDAAASRLQHRDYYLHAQQAQHRRAPHGSVA